MLSAPPSRRAQSHYSLKGWKTHVSLRANDKHADLRSWNSLGHLRAIGIANVLLETSVAVKKPLGF